MSRITTDIAQPPRLIWLGTRRIRRALPAPGSRGRDGAAACRPVHRHPRGPDDGAPGRLRLGWAATGLNLASHKDFLWDLHGE
jgi:hypothetical protein